MRATISVYCVPWPSLPDCRQAQKPNQVISILRTFHKRTHSAATISEQYESWISCIDTCIIQVLGILTYLDHAKLHIHLHSTNKLPNNRCQMSLLIIPRLEKRITQRHCLNTLHIWIHNKLRINVKEHRHVHRLTRIQPLLLEAKALDLAEIRRYLSGCYAVRCYANDVFGRFIGRGVECECRLAG
jgi:hypothetical protein